MVRLEPPSQEVGGLRAWPRLLSFSIGILPVAALVAIAALLTVKTVEAFQDIGYHELLSNNFQSQYSTGKNIFGLFPGMWGTLTIAFLALILAFPVALAMALLSSEFSLG